MAEIVERLNPSMASLLRRWKRHSKAVSFVSLLVVEIRCTASSIGTGKASMNWEQKIVLVWA